MPRVKQFDQEEALHKAMLLFWQKGYYDTSIQDLTERLGISRGSLYDTFGGKKQLFDQVFAQYSSTSLIGLKGFLDTQQNVKEAFRKIFTKTLTDDQTDPNCKGCFMVNTTTEMLPTDAALLEAITRHKEGMEKLFYELLQMGVRSGEISAHKDLQVIAKSLYTLMIGFRVLGKTQPDLQDSLAALEAVLVILD